MTLSHATIIPLIGGMALAHEQVLKSKPKWILSYSAFGANEKHLLEYYKNDIPYSFIDEGAKKFENVDIISTVCPCAGLSSLSVTSSPDSKVNEWMYKSATHILENYQPQVFWGENAPVLATNKGFPVLKRLYAIGKQNGYTLAIYRTASKLHGNPQIRSRSFYFFWKGDRVPVFNWFEKPRRKLLDVLNAVPSTATQQDLLMNPKTPSQDPLYDTILNIVGMNHQEFIKSLDRSYSPIGYMHKHNIMDKALEYTKEKNYEIAHNFIQRAKDKFSKGLGVMDRGINFPGEYIGAFVGGLPTGLVHPIQDRYLNVRECLTLMDLPFDFELQQPVNKNLNHICQNVPMNTAKDMVGEIAESLNGNREFVKANKNIVFMQNNNNMKNSYVEIEKRSLLAA